MMNHKLEMAAAWAMYALLAMGNAAVWAAFARFCRAPWEIVILIFTMAFLIECVVISVCVNGKPWRGL